MDNPTHTYALLDCSAHDHAWRELSTRFPDVQWRSLFDGTPEEHLTAAAPLLIAAQREHEALIKWLAQLEQAAPSVSWITSPYTLPVLAPMLTRRLNCEIDDGQLVVLRFYDPRILLGLPSALDAQQKRYFFAPVSAWSALEPRRRQRYSIDIVPATPADIARYAFAPISLTLAQRDQLMYFDKRTCTTASFGTGKRPARRTSQASSAACCAKRPSQPSAAPAATASPIPARSTCSPA